MTRVLIVDDDLAILSVVSNLLEFERGWTVETSAGGPQGRERLDDDDLPTPELLVLDVMMPELDGFELLSWIRDHPRLYDLPVVMLTAKTELHDEHEGFLRGCDAYVRKPFGAEELIRVLDVVLEASPDLRVARRYERLHELIRSVRA